MKNSKAAEEKIHQDCLYFQGDRPCLPHKLYGVHCQDCDLYTPSKKALIIKLGASGDVLRTTALLSPLRKKLGPISVTWVTKEESFPLLEHNPYITKLISPQEAPALLYQQTFDFAINPDADLQSAALLTRCQSFVKKGIALDEQGKLLPLNRTAQEWFEMGLQDQVKRKNQKTYQQILLDMAELPAEHYPVHYWLTYEEEQDRRRWIDSLGLTGKRKVGLFTGAGRRFAYKQWTEQGFSQLIGMLLKRDCQVLLLGGPDEKEKNRRLKKKHPEVIDTGCHPLREFAIILSLCDVLVCGDTLPLHLAVALKVPVVALFGPTSQAEIELYGSGSKIYPDLDCLSCYLPRCHRKPSCMELIPAETVFKEILKWLN